MQNFEMLRFRKKRHSYLSIIQLRCEIWLNIFESTFFLSAFLDDSYQFVNYRGCGINGLETTSERNNLSVLHYYCDTDNCNSPTNYPVEDLRTKDFFCAKKSLTGKETIEKCESKTCIYQSVLTKNISGCYSDTLPQKIVGNDLIANGGKGDFYFSCIFLRNLFF